MRRIGLPRHIDLTPVTSNTSSGSPLRFSAVNWFGEPKIWKQVFADRLLFKVLLVYAAFWFTGGVVALTITLFGKIQLQLPDMVTAGFNASMGLGIGIGSVWAAKISHKDVRLGLIQVGSIGLCTGLVLVSIFAILPIPVGLKCRLIGGALFLGGFFGGWMAVPLQVFIQAHPADELKGRIIAVMNLMTWCGILLASVSIRRAGSDEFQHEPFLDPAIRGSHRIAGRLRASPENRRASTRPSGKRNSRHRRSTALRGAQIVGWGREDTELCARLHHLGSTPI